MIRLTVTLIVAIYIVLIVVPGPDHGENTTVTRTDGQNWLVSLITDAESNAQTPPDRPASAARSSRATIATALTETDNGLTFETADGEQLIVSAVIDPTDLPADTGENGLAIGNITVADPVEQAPEAVQVADARILWRVTGDRVNFRAGPSTNTAILGALVRGDQVEFLAEAPDDWAHLRVVNTGLEGYMAMRFLEPVN